MGKNDGEADKPKLKRKDYENELEKLQVELCHMQEWVKATGYRGKGKPTRVSGCCVAFTL
jgi:polyphosphate kinase 2 (PPK2 family)